MVVRELIDTAAALGWLSGSQQDKGSTLAASDEGSKAGRKLQEVVWSAHGSLNNTFHLHMLQGRAMQTVSSLKQILPICSASMPCNATLINSFPSL